MRDEYNFGSAYQAPEERRKPAERSEADDVTLSPQMVRRGFARLGNAIDRAFPNPRNRDEMAIYLARRTPRALAICIGLLLAGIIASRLDVWQEGFLWGIPSLGAISMGVGWWVWSSNIAKGRLSPEVREALQRAIRLQYLMLGAFVLGILYFFGMALRLW